MAVEFTDGIKNVNPRPEVRRQYNEAGQRYTSTAQVLSEVDVAIRYVGQNFFTEDGEYHFASGTTNADLVKKDNSIINAIIFG